MKKIFILLFIMGMFLGTGSFVSAGACGAVPNGCNNPEICAVNTNVGGDNLNYCFTTTNNCPSSCTNGQRCLTHTTWSVGACLTPVPAGNATTGFGVSLSNPLCLSGEVCVSGTPTPQCDNRAWEAIDEDTGIPYFGDLASCCHTYVSPTTTPPPCVNSFPQFISQISGYVVGLISSIVVIMMVWAGFLFVTSAGNPGKIDKAKQVVIWAVIGAAVALAASGLTSVVTYIIGRPPA